MEFKDRLVQLRKSTKLYQADMAKKIGVARATYGAYEQGTRQPDFDTLKKIADYFGVSTDYLLGHSVEDKNITMIAGETVDLSRFDERQLKILEWAWERKGLSAINDINDLEKKLEEMSLIYDFIEKNNKDKDSKKS